MALGILKDRSVTLTLENSLSQNKQIAKKVADYYLPKRGLAGTLVEAVTESYILTLSGPNNIAIEYSADVGEEQGVYTSFLQPWFIKPVRISIRGDSYIGAYTLLSCYDNDTEGILRRFKTSQNDFSGQLGRPGDMQRVQLEINNSPLGFKKFLGYFTKFNVSEVVQKVYLQEYQIEFVGRNIDDIGVSKGAANANKAKDVAMGRATPSNIK